MKDDELRRMVKEWFTQTASYEWRRLNQDPYHQIEYFLTMNFLEIFKAAWQLYVPPHIDFEVVIKDNRITALVKKVLRLRSRKKRRNRENL